jgi:hypothetical protein
MLASHTPGLATAFSGPVRIRYSRLGSRSFGPLSTECGRVDRDRYRDGVPGGGGRSTGHSTTRTAPPPRPEPSHTANHPSPVVVCPTRIGVIACNTASGISPKEGVWVQSLRPIRWGAFL